MKIVLKTGLVILLLAATAYLALYYKNNRNIAYPAATEINTAYDGGVKWLLDNRTALLNHPNVFLWWMLKESTGQVPNPAISGHVDEFEARYADLSQRSVWSGLFRKNSRVPVKYNDIRQQEYYKQNFVAAIYCNTDLFDIPLISAQDYPGFCNRTGYWHRPACATNQMLGLRMRKTSNCRTGEALDHAITGLQNKIALQLKLDPRVVDVYIQRVLMLVESGAAEKLELVWLRRITDAQLDDGGWSSDEKLLAIPGGDSLNFGNFGFSIKKAGSDFHTTAQGIYQMSLLMANDEAG
jgi:hypothetical protein